MTVIKGQKAYFIKPGSSQASDTESLHLGSTSASDTESLNNEPITRPRIIPFKSSPSEEPLYFHKSFGRRKLRRYYNRCILQTLEEEDETQNVVDAHKSPLTRLLEDSKAIEFWNKFIEKSEEEQENILNSLTIRDQKNKYNDNDSDTNYQLGWISSRTKKTFKSKKNLSIETIKDCENDMLQFFLKTPNDFYIRDPPTSFDKLLLKVIARYHGLQTKTVSIDGKEKPCIQIFNTNEHWVKANCFLTDFIQQLR